MIYFNTTLRETAMRIINMKSTHGDIKAGADIFSAQTAINTYNPLNLIQAQELDAKLRREYSEIGMLQVAIDNFPMTQVPFTTQSAPEPAIVTCLKFDIKGIMTAVLFSHGIIEQAKELIETVSNY